jgi:sialidase-1
MKSLTLILRIQTWIILAGALILCNVFCHAVPQTNMREALKDNDALVKDSLPSDDFVHLHGGIDNFFLRVKGAHEVSVAFLGGSITAGPGWRDLVVQYLEQKYPETKWKFLNAGIPSLGSLPHAFRLETDVISAGRVDLLFVESAVNDLANGTPVIYQRRALEGIVRHARQANPEVDIVLMAFADEPKLADYAAGKIPVEVGVHDEVARHYKLPFLNLSEEVFRRIKEKEFTWKDDFIDLHPSPFGHQLYFRTIRRMFELSAKGRPASRIRSAKLPAPMDPFNYSQGRYVPVNKAKAGVGFRVDPSWKPSDEVRTRKRFVEVPMLVSNEPGSSFEFSFEGNAVGIALVSGPDAGMIRYSIDDGKEQTMDLYTQWSKSLHLPWYLVLGDGLGKGRHTLRVTLLQEHHPKATGSACRVVHFLVNGPSKDAKE